MCEWDVLGYEMGERQVGNLAIDILDYCILARLAARGIIYRMIPAGKPWVWRHPKKARELYYMSV